MKRKSFIPIAIILCNTAVAYAQKNLSEDIDVIRPYKAILAEGIRLRTNPEVFEIKNAEPQASYKFSDKKLDQTISIIGLPPEKMKSESITKLYKGYLKGGFGNITTALGELYVANTRDTKNQYGVSLKHLSSNGKNARDFSTDKFSVFGKTLLGKQQISGNVFYDRNASKFYGFDEKKFNSDNFKNNLKQRYQTIGGEAEIYNTETNEYTLGYAAKISGYSFSDLYKAKENNVLAGLHLKKNIDEFKAEIDISLDATNSKDVRTIKNTIFKIAPSFHFTQDVFSIKAGFVLASESGFIKKTHFFPSAYASVNIVEEKVVAFTGITGDVAKNSLRNFSNENQFLAPNLNLRNTIENLHFYGGLKGSLGSNFSFKAWAGVKSVKNLAFFVNDSTDERKFKVIYDDGNIGITSLTTELNYQQSEKLRLYGSIRLDAYSLKKVARAWHKPGSRAEISASYNFVDKFIIRTSLFYVGQRNALVNFNTNSFIQLKGYADLNLGIEYRYSKTLSAFVNLNNLTSTKYQLWRNYESYGFNALGGVTFSF